MSPDDILKFVSNVGLPGIFILGAMWFVRQEVWPWFKTEYWKQRVHESSRRLELEAIQTEAITQMKLILAKLEVVATATQDAVFSTQQMLGEHRRETRPAIENISDLIVDVNVLKESARRGKAATDEVPKVPPVPKASRAKKGAAAKSKTIN